MALLDNVLAFFLFFYLSIFLTDYSFLFQGNGISNIWPPTLILSFLIFIRWHFDKKNFHRSKFYKIISISNRISGKNLLIFSGCALFLVFSAVSIARYFSLSSGTSDLGIFDQAVWNASKSGALFSSLKHNINLLGDHFEPVLFLVVPFYKVFPSALVLLILQSVLLASAVVPLYLIAKKKIREKPIIYAIIISYMLSRPLRGVAFSDFHPECFILLALFWAYYFLMEEKNALFLLSLSFLLLCKEDVTFLIMGFGIFMAVAKKRLLPGVFLLASGLGLWFIETNVIIPYFNGQGGYGYMNRLPLGLTYADNIKAIVNNPLLPAKILFDKYKIEYALKLFAPLLFLPLLSPGHYILFAIPLLKNIVANQDFNGFYNITSHYTAGIIPFVYIAAIYGAAKLAGRIKNRRSVFCLSISIILSSLFFYGKTDGHQFNKFLEGIKEGRTLVKLSYLKIIPPDASVAANFNLVPHMSERKYIYEWNPQSVESNITEYVVIDKGLLGYLSKDNIAAIAQYIANITNKGYRKIFESGDSSFLIFHNPSIDKTLVEKLK